MLCIDSGNIYSPLNKKEYSYSTFHRANDKYLQEVLDFWGAESEKEIIAIKKSCANKSAFISEVDRKNIYDYFWDWEDIIKNPDGYSLETFYLTANCDGRAVQGILHAYFPEPSKIATGCNIVYIDRLAVAPWNRQILGDKKLFKGVGSRLVIALCDYSKQKGLKGCLGLHALPAAEPFYRGFNMVDLGIDSTHEGLRYFELDESQARAL
ncbi:hypothetical protein ACIPTZ_00825 [Pectobacterium sp. CHL-2024]|uniref:hypothetical protein n=1 Tax=Pectobacterium sp. CHL-2024 TaxID=3377079 RepID=UPI00380F19DE